MVFPLDLEGKADLGSRLHAARTDVPIKNATKNKRKIGQVEKGKKLKRARGEDSYVRG